MFFLIPTHTVDVAGRRFGFDELDVGDLSSDAEILAAVRERVDVDLADYAVVRMPGPRLLLRVPLALRVGRAWRAYDERCRVVEERLGRLLAPLGRALAPLGRALVRALAAVGRGLSAAFRPVGWLLNGLGRSLTALARALGRLLRALSPLLDRLERFFNRLGGGGEAAEAQLARLFAALRPLVQRLGRGLQALVVRPLGRGFRALVVRPLASLGRALGRAFQAGHRALLRPFLRWLSAWLSPLGAWLYGSVVTLVTGRDRAQRELDHRVAILDSLLTTPHRQLGRIHPVHQAIREQDPLFYPHLAAWYFEHGEIRDHQEMFVVCLVTSPEAEHRETGLALLRKLPPYQLARVVDFIRGRVVKGRKVGLFRNPPRSLRTEVERYLREREGEPAAFDGAVLAARGALKRLYTTLHIRPSKRAQAILFDNRPPRDSRLFAVKQLANCGDPAEQAAIIREHRLPFRVAVGAVSSLSPQAAAAVVEQMSPQEAINSLATLKRRGLLEDGAIEKLLAEKLERAQTAGRVAAFKTEAAAKAAELGEEWEARLKAVTQEQVKKRGRLTVPTALLIDASASMESALEVGKRVAAMLALVAQAHLEVLAFNSRVIPVQARGLEYADWEAAFGELEAQGATSVGAALVDLYRRRVEVEQVVIVSDQRENHRPRFESALRLYRRKVQPHLRLCFVNLADSDHRLEATARRLRVPLQSYTFNGDYYSLPELLPILSRPSRLALLGEILATPLPQR